MSSHTDADEVDGEVWSSTGHLSEVFPGLFKNPNYKNTELFLHEDEQTRITESVLRIAALANNKRDVSTLAEIFAVSQEVNHRQGPHPPPWFTNTASQILTKGRFTGCTDFAIAFATLARAKGIPAIIVDSAQVEWIKSGCSPEPVKGHFFVEVFVENKWQLLDSGVGKLYKDYDANNWCLPEGYVAFAKSLSVIDSGADEATHNALQQIAFLKGKTDYCDPDYACLDLGDERLLDNEFLNQRKGIPDLIKSFPHNKREMVISREGKSVIITAGQAAVDREKALSVDFRGPSRYAQKPSGEVLKF